jgi:8-oxo-dGTP pyrophosphatase MutT (NUDIX family)
MERKKMMEKYWKRRGVERVFQNDIFSVYHKEYHLHPRDVEGTFATIDTSNWVNVIPVTGEGNIILIKQFRHGIEGTTVEIPGGGIDSGDEKPLAAAARELREETGYSARNWDYLGCVTPNPAILNNYCYTYLARDLERRGGNSSDRMEYIEVFQASFSDVKEMLRDGTISHALVLAAFAHYLLKGYRL